MQIYDTINIMKIAHKFFNYIGIVLFIIMVPFNLIYACGPASEKEVLIGKIISGSIIAILLIGNFLFIRYRDKKLSFVFLMIFFNLIFIAPLIMIIFNNIILLLVALPILVFLNYLFIKNKSKKLSIILLIIFFNLSVISLWAVYNIVTATFCA